MPYLFDDFETFKMLTKSGPLHPLVITKILLKSRNPTKLKSDYIIVHICESTNLFFKYMCIDIFEIVEFKILKNESVEV